MATEIIVSRALRGLEPVSAYDSELLALYPLGKMLTAKLTQKRSGNHHRFYWALLERVKTATGRFPTAESLHEALKIELGYVQAVISLKGEITLVPKSTGFANMDQAEFRIYFEAALSAILSLILRGVRRQDLLTEVESMLGFTFDSLWTEKRLAA